MRPCEHIADDPLVPRNIDNPSAGSIRQSEVSKSKIDRNPALLLLLEPISVLSSKRLDKRSLAMIDMTSSTNDSVSNSRSHFGADVTPPSERSKERRANGLISTAQMVDGQII